MSGILKPLAALGIILALASPALARDRSSVDYGRLDNSHYRHQNRNRSGAWIGNNRGHFGGPHHGARWGAGHDHFSPRGQGGHHWGW
jgi:hypothetical protein